MFIERLNLENFRNISKISLEFNEHINLIYGQNGQGKTSILEAIYTLAITRSFKAKTEKTFLQNLKSYLEIKGELKTSNEDGMALRFYYSKEEGKNIFLNNNKIKKYSEIIGLVPIVLLSPEDLELMFGMPAHRRRFMDILLSQVSPSYLVSLQRFKRALLQRNRLLSQIHDGSETSHVLDPWNEQVVQYGAEVTLSRFRLSEYLRERLSEYYHFISDQNEVIDVNYRSSLVKEKEPSIESLKAEYQDVLNKRLDDDLRQMSTGAGPHRDDLLFLKDGYPLKSHGSQGENKTVLIALKLVEREYLQAKLREKPVMLLDDVFGELDDDRVKHLMGHIRDSGQSFITTTVRDKFPAGKMPDIHFIHIHDGAILN